MRSEIRTLYDKSKDNTVLESNVYPVHWKHWVGDYAWQYLCSVMKHSILNQA